MTRIDVLDFIAELPAKTRVIARSVITLLAAAQAVAVAVVAELGDDIPLVARVGSYVVAALAAAVAGLRRVTPVEPDERGVLPR